MIIYIQLFQLLYIYIYIYLIISLRGNVKEVVVLDIALKKMALPPLLPSCGQTTTNFVGNFFCSKSPDTEK